MLHHKNRTHKHAFTLAEVLITLGIIGVVAAMTMPTLIANQKEKETVAKLKKMYSVLSQAYLLSVEKYGTPDEWGFGNRDAGSSTEDDTDYVAGNAKIMKDKLFEQIKNIKVCEKGLNKTECGLGDKYYYANGSIASELNSKVSALSMIDGNGIMVLINNGSCSENRGDGKHLNNICGWVFVDTNGSKPPNTIGKDLFGFYLTKYGIIPSGTKEETNYSIYHATGHGRTAWIIFNENTDYLKCNDLNWVNKTKCK